jgi:hypothetical protein
MVSHHFQKHIGKMLLASLFANLGKRAFVDQLATVEQPKAITDSLGFIQPVSTKYYSFAH